MSNVMVNYPLIIITGAGRSGKTLLSKLLASHKNVDWIEEPVSIGLILKARGSGMMNDACFKSIFPLALSELIYEHSILRNGNLRPNDMSSIYAYKSPDEIATRLESEVKREDVLNQSIRENHYFIIDIPELLGYTEFIKECCTRVITINVVRDKDAVVSEVVAKGWYSEHNLKGGFENELRMWDDRYGAFFPFWLNTKDRASFLEADDYGRATIYWETMNQYAKTRNPNDIVVSYNEIVNNTDALLDRLNDFIELYPTEYTEKIKASFWR